MAGSTDTVSIAEISKRLGYHRDTIKRWIRTGQFPGYMPSPGEYVVTRQMFDGYLAGTFVPAKRNEEGAAA